MCSIWPEFDTWPLFAMCLLVSDYCLSPYCLQILCFYPFAVWGPGTVYSFSACIRLLFEALLLFTGSCIGLLFEPLLFTDSVLLSVCCLRPRYSLHFLCLYRIVLKPCFCLQLTVLVSGYCLGSCYCFCACIQLLFGALLLFLCLYPVTVRGSYAVYSFCFCSILLLFVAQSL
jgi:hypothetical protein